MSEKKYALTWSLAKGPVTVEEARAAGAGACDALVIVSILRERLDEPFVGGKSFAVVDVDGRDLEMSLPAAEIFQAFGAIASDLLRRPDLPEWQRNIAQATLTCIRSAMAEAREARNHGH